MKSGHVVNGYASRILGIAAAIMVSVASSRADVMYTVTGLGMFPGGTSSQANAINNLGQIVGYCEVNSDSEAFLWTSSGGMQTLGTLGLGTDANGINDSGLVVGSWYGEGFTYTNSGGAQYLGVVPGTQQTQPLSVNIGGQVVGECATGIVPGGGGFMHAFLYTPGYGMLDLGTLGGNSQANGINSSGTVVGFSTTATSPYDHAFIYTAAGGMRDLGALPGVATGATATAINNDGQVVGYSGGHAFMYTTALGMQDLGLFPGALGSGASGINNVGQIVGGGYMQGGGSHAFVYSSVAGMQDLNSLISPSSGWTLEDAIAINDSGEIVGYGIDPSGQTEAFLLTPTPEPGTLSLLTICGLLLVRRRRGC